MWSCLSTSRGTLPAGEGNAGKESASTDSTPPRAPFDNSKWLPGYLVPYARHRHLTLFPACRPSLSALSIQISPRGIAGCEWCWPSWVRVESERCSRRQWRPAAGAVRETAAGSSRLCCCCCCCCWCMCCSRQGWGRPTSTSWETHRTRESCTMLAAWL